MLQLAAQLYKPQQNKFMLRHIKTESDARKGKLVLTFAFKKCKKIFMHK